MRGIWVFGDFSLFCFIIISIETSCSSYLEILILSSSLKTAKSHKMSRAAAAVWRLYILHSIENS